MLSHYHYYYGNCHCYKSPAYHGTDLGEREVLSESFVCAAGMKKKRQNCFRVRKFSLIFDGLSLWVIDQSWHWSIIILLLLLSGNGCCHVLYVLKVV